MRKINFAQGLIVILFAVSMAGCDLYETIEEKQSDAGVVLTSITLDNSSLYLYGSTGAVSQTLTASYAPCYAADTVITWTSSNESVATVSANGKTCTITLKGNGTSIVTAANAAGGVQSTCTVTGVLETVAPFAISGLTKTGEYGNNIRFSWTNPSKNADDLSGIRIRTYQCADASSVNDSNWISDTDVKNTEKGAAMTAAVSGLTAETQYSFIFYAVDVNGNKSEAVTATGTTTASDSSVSAPANISVVSSDLNGITLSWTASADSDIEYYRISAASSVTGAVIPEPVTVSGTLTTGLISGLSAVTPYTFTVTAVDYNFNEASDVSASYTTNNFATNLAAAVSSDLSGTILLTWTDPLTDINFDHVTITCTDGSSTVTKDVAAGKKTYRFSGLTSGTQYSFYIDTMNASGISQGRTAAVTATPVTVLWQIYNTYSSSGAQMVPNITTSNSYKNVVTPTDVSGYTYTYWKVVPSLAYSPDAASTAANYDTDDTSAFSLEATDAAGTETGLYLCIDSVQTYSNDPIGWGYSSSSHPNHVWALAPSTLTSDGLNVGYASFTTAASSYTGTTYSGKSAWYLFKCVPDGTTTYYLYDTYLNVSGETSVTVSSSDYVFAYAKTIIN